jgi:hypothetical protein
MVGTKEHRDLVQQVADQSLTVLINDGVFPTNTETLGNIVHILIQKKNNDPVPAVVAAKLDEALPVEETFFLKPQVDPALYQKALAAAQKADTVIVSLFNQRTVYLDNGPLKENQLSLVRQVMRAKPRAIVMSYGNPYLVQSFNEAGAFVVGYGEGGFYGNQIVYADAFIRLLQGEIQGEGKLPVTLGE